jgi:hypothetical protein
LLRVLSLRRPQPAQDEARKVEQKQYESFKTELASSGMIEAAAQAAAQLAALFQNQ